MATVVVVVTAVDAVVVVNDVVVDVVVVDGQVLHISLQPCMCVV